MPYEGPKSVKITQAWRGAQSAGARGIARNCRLNKHSVQGLKAYRSSPIWDRMGPKNQVEGA